MADRRQWDVFLSFRGKDTRDGFTKSLHEALIKDKRQALRVFLDDEGLRRGDEIASSLQEAIEDSAVAVVVLSKSYADSHWCLEELARICDLSAAKLIIPVFYLVDPSEVRQQTGPFENDFRAHEERFGIDEASRWRKALKMVGGLAGISIFDKCNEADIIKSLVTKVEYRISKTPISLPEYTVGLEALVEELAKLLELKSNGVKVLGLHGMGGIGKTTLAKALFNNLVGRAGFESRSFVYDVKESMSRENGLESLKRKLVLDLSSDKKSLVVLDDIDSADQLNSLISANRGRLSFEGTRIIVTTRDQEALPEKIVNVKYEVRQLSSDAALQLFSHYALKREKPTEDLRSLSEEIVKLTGGLPLALEVFGSMLYHKRRVEEWRDSVRKLREIRPANLQDVLKISYDGLDAQEKCVFLDIACLFAGAKMKRDYLVDVLSGCGFNGEIAISNLTAKSLVKITYENAVSIHDQIRDMGRQIVKEENMVDPHLRSRLWNRDDVMAVLFENQRRTPCTQGIVLDYPTRETQVKIGVDGDKIAWNRLMSSPNFSNALSYAKEKYARCKENEAERSEDIKISGKALGNMPNLRLLQVNNVSLEGELKFPPQLKWLQWKGCPLKYLGADIPSLAVLDLSESNIDRVWNWYNSKVGENLKVLNLSHCYRLVAVPIFSSKHKLEKLILNNCVNLTEIGDSIGNSNTLIHLDLQRCKNLTKLPLDVSGWKSLQTLILTSCSELKKLPENIGSAKSLKELFVDETAIESLPESIFRLTSLETLNLNHCSRLKKLPDCIGTLSSLKELSLVGSGLEELPDSIGGLENLERLSVIMCSSLTVLPDSIGDLKQLQDLSSLSTPIRELPVRVGLLPNLNSLSIGNGGYIGALPRSINGLHSLVELKIRETSIAHLPDEIRGLRSLKMLDLWRCKSLVSLPESIGDILSLTNLIIFEGIIKELPESIGKLKNLATMGLNSCRELKKLPDSIGDLRSLHRLLLKETAIIELPKKFGNLSSLVELQVSKNPRAIGYTAQEGVFFPDSFSNLSSLSELNARGRKITGEIHDDFEKLASLETLDLGYNVFTRLPSSLRGLSILTELILPNCTELTDLPPLPSSLIKINLSNCFALETISDLSNLGRLEELDLTNCERIEDIPGLECLDSMKRLFLSCCDKCSLITKKRLAKASLRKIRNLSMPGSKIPSWFTRDVVTFTEQRNRPIKGMIICVVVSLDHGIEDENINNVPMIVDIQAQLLKQDHPVFTTVFNLSGVPRSSGDQVHLCRYSTNFPLVSLLKDGFKIAVTRKNPPFMKGVELKKWGVHLIYEGDDDYEGDEESLKESQQSISEKLARFFSTYEDEEEEDGLAAECSFDVETEAAESSVRA